MPIWKWNGANDAFTTLQPMRDEDLISGTFMADGTPKTWITPPQVKPGIERQSANQRPLGDISFVMGGSVVLNDKAYAALGAFLLPFGQFLDLDLVGKVCLGGGNQPLHFYNVTRVVRCIDFERSETEGSKVLRPVFRHDAVPTEAQVFKDPLRKKIDVYVNDAAHGELSRLMVAAGVSGSTFTLVG